MAPLELKAGTDLSPPLSIGEYPCQQQDAGLHSKPLVITENLGTHPHPGAGAIPVDSRAGPARVSPLNALAQLSI
jgi:hypothetical protein